MICSGVLRLFFIVRGSFPGCARMRSSHKAWQKAQAGDGYDRQQQ